MTVVFNVVLPGFETASSADACPTNSTMLRTESTNRARLVVIRGASSNARRTSQPTFIMAYPG
jgi:hypothetical protein